VITDVPVAKPFTMPEPDPIEATVGLLLVQVPPEAESTNVTDEPMHNELEPVIATAEA